MSVVSHELAECEIFDSLSPVQLSDVLKQITTETYQPGSVILEEGKLSRGLWLIAEGRCEVVKLGAAGAGRILAELAPGAVFGEMSFLEAAPHSASVRAVTAVRTLRLTSESFACLEESSPRAASAVIRAISVVLAKRLRRMDEWTTRLLDDVMPQKHQEWADFRAKLYNESRV